jgi:CheY-like chemotaxis protein
MNAAVFDTCIMGVKKVMPQWLLASRRTRIPVSLAQKPVLPSGKRVLVVDDDAVVRLATSTILRNRGFEVVTAADCSEAIGAVAEGRPDIILLDLTFPPDVSCGGTVSWDGLGLMRWLLGLKNAKGSRFIVITGSDSEEYQQRALRAGVSGFLRKPFDQECLLDTISQALNQAPGNPAPPDRIQFKE